MAFKDLFHETVSKRPTYAVLVISVCLNLLSPLLDQTLQLACEDTSFFGLHVFCFLVVVHFQILQHGNHRLSGPIVGLTTDNRHFDKVRAVLDLDRERNLLLFVESEDLLD